MQTNTLPTKKVKTRTIYVGIDVHKNSLYVTAIDEDDNILLDKRIMTNHYSVAETFKQFPADKTRYVMESSSVWYGLYRYMTDELGFDVVLSNPYQTKAIAASKKKTDKVDSKILAELLRGGYIAECYVPDHDTIDSKRLVRHRQGHIKNRTRYKNLIHGILLQSGIQIQGTTFSKRYNAELRKLDDYRINSYLRMIESLNIEINECDVRIADKVKRSKDAQLLKSIPGIGDYSALVITAEIGEISRFNDSHKLCAYAGLVPSVRNSADKVVHGKITKQGSRIMRWILAEAVHTHVRYYPNTNVSKFYFKLAEKRGKSKATVATAAKLLRVIHCMLREEKKFVV